MIFKNYKFNNITFKSYNLNSNIWVAAYQIQTLKI